MFFAVETILKVCLCTSLYRKYMSTCFELSQQDKKIQRYSKTGYQPCGFHSRFYIKFLGQPFTFHLSLSNQFSSVQIFTEQPPPLKKRTDLVPEFDLSIPAACDDLGGFVRMPQGAYAHLVVSLDPVVELGGLPIPDVQLSICIS